MISAFCILAESDFVAWMAIVVGVASMLLGLGTAVILARVQRNQQLQDAARAARVKKDEEDRASAAAKVKGLEESLAGAEARQHMLVEKLVDERFRAVTHQVNSHAQSVVIAIDEIKDRLKDGDGAMNSLADRDQKIELAVSAKFDVLKDWIREGFTAHERIDAESFGRVGNRMSEIAAQLGVLAGKVEQQHPRRHP